jgi:hypothetical protein
VLGGLTISPVPGALITQAEIPTVILGSQVYVPTPGYLVAANGGLIALTVTIDNPASLVCSGVDPTIGVTKVLAVSIRNIVY